MIVNPYILERNFKYQEDKGNEPHGKNCRGKTEFETQICFYCKKVHWNTIQKEIPQA